MLRINSLLPILLALSLLSLPACENMFDKKVPARDFNELIPRFMNAANRGTPEEAAANLWNVTNPDERRDAIAYLETKPYGHEPPYMRAYEALTTDPHPLVRAQALRALGTSGKPEAVPLLIHGKNGRSGLNDPDPGVRRDAAIGLTTTFGPDAIPPLIAHVKDDVDDQVRLNCARALIHASTPEAIRALIEALDDKDAGVIFYAHKSLVAITHQDLGQDPRAWLAWYQQTYNPTPTTSSAPTSQPAASQR